jgi:hypothetical protein
VPTRSRSRAARKAQPHWAISSGSTRVTQTSQSIVHNVVGIARGLITLAQLDKAILTTAVLGLGSKPQSCYFASGQPPPYNQPDAVAKPSENEPPEDDAKSQKTKVKFHQCRTR